MPESVPKYKINVSLLTFDGLEIKARFVFLYSPSGIEWITDGKALRKVSADRAKARFGRTIKIDRNRPVLEVKR